MLPMLIGIVGRSWAAEDAKENKNVNDGGDSGVHCNVLHSIRLIFLLFFHVGIITNTAHDFCKRA